MSCRNEPKLSASDPDDFERRLNTRLEEHRARHAPPRDSGAWKLAVRYGSEFAGGVIVGAGLGYLADRFLGWTPWGLPAGVLMGFAAGVLNVVRAAQSMSRSDDASH